MTNINITDTLKETAENLEKAKAFVSYFIETKRKMDFDDIAIIIKCNATRAKEYGRKIFNYWRRCGFIDDYQIVDKSVIKTPKHNTELVYGALEIKNDKL